MVRCRMRLSDYLYHILVLATLQYYKASSFLFQSEIEAISKSVKSIIICWAAFKSVYHHI